MVDGLPVPADRLDTVQTYLTSWLSDEGIPGASVAVTDVEGRTWIDGAGSRDLASNNPATGDTLYGVGSITKSFTALAVLQLVQRGEVTLDDPITSHVAVSIPGHHDRTIESLLTHRSGIPSLATSEALIARQAGLGEAGVPLGGREDLYRHLAGAGDLIEPPNERFLYANIGYVLLADLVEAVDGRPLPEYLREAVLDPLGMDRSTFSATAFQADDDHITPYRLDDAGEPVETALPVRELSWGPGGLLTSVGELAPYLRLQLTGGTVDGTSLIDSGLLERAHTGHVETPVGPYGYGWRTRSVGGHEVIGHGGSIAVSTAYAGFVPAANIGVAVAANAAPPFSLAHVGEAVTAAALGECPRSVPHFARKDRLERITGIYETYRGIRTATVEVVDGHLEITFDDPFGEVRQLLTPADPAGDSLEFYRIGDRSERRPVEFRIDDDGVGLFIDRWHLRKQ